MNSVMLTGRLVKKPELKFSNTGIEVCSFRMAIRKNENNAIFIDCVSFRETAKNIANWGDKGRHIAIAGELNQRNWQAQDGTNRTTVEVNVYNFEFLDKKNTAPQAAPQTAPQAETQQPKTLQPLKVIQPNFTQPNIEPEFDPFGGDDD